MTYVKSKDGHWKDYDKGKFSQGNDVHIPDYIDNEYERLQRYQQESDENEAKKKLRIGQDAKSQDGQE